MEGKILGIDIVQNKAVIITKNSERITFDLYEWRGTIPIKEGLEIDYELNDSSQAINVYPSLAATTVVQNKEKSKVALLLLTLVGGGLGAHKFYLKQPGYGVLYFFLFFLYGLSVIFSLVNFIQLITMSQEKFDIKYNPEYKYYSQFEIK